MNYMPKPFHKSSGFTLMELLVVITVIIVLGIALLVSINPMSQILKGFDTRRKSDLNKIKIAFEAYYSDHDCYPPSSVLSQCGSAALEPYLSSIPCDPSSKAAYKIKILPENSSCPQQFAVYASTASLFGSSNITGCPNTYAIYSSNMGSLDLIRGCGTTTQTCNIIYGCVSGACTIIGVDQLVTCRNGTSSCDTDCGGLNCGRKRANGSYINECDPVYQ